MPYFDEKFVDLVKEKNQIQDVVGRYCSLVRKGNKLWACCPLPTHNEKTPSFTVNEIGQFYHCFGCGAHGDVIKFVMEMDNLTYPEAITSLAEHARIELPKNTHYDEEKSKENKEKLERLGNILRDAAKFYFNNLYSGHKDCQKFVDYLNRRKITTDIAKKFGIGVSLDFNSLPKHLINLGYNEQDIIDSGVCRKNDKGNLYDFEADRLIIPIINSLGNVVAFGGRVLEKKPTFGKYKNTEETIIWNKRKNLFGLNLLRNLRKIQQFSYVIMVEGYMDAISLYQGGFKNVVASMGTSLTIEQAKLLKRYTDKVVVSYDGDAAGQNATIRSLDIFDKEGFTILVLKLPEGEDPDDVIKNRGKEFYQELIDNAVPLTDFKIDVMASKRNLSDVVDKRNFISESLQYISTIKEQFIRDELLKRVSNISKTSYDSLKLDLESGRFGEIKDVEQNIDLSYTPPQLVDNNAIIKAERYILRGLLNKESFISDEVYTLTFSNESRNRIMDIVLSNSELPLNKISELINEEDLNEYSVILTNDQNFLSTKEELQYYNDCLKTVKKSNLMMDIDRFKMLYNSTDDLDKKREYLDYITKYTIELKKLR